VLTAHPQQFATGDQRFKPRAGDSELGYDRGGGDNLLHVVEQQEHFPIAERTTEALGQRRAVGILKLEDAGDLTQDTIRFLHRLQGNQHHVVACGGPMRGASFEGEASLAHAAGAGESKQSYIISAQEVEDRRDLRLTANKRRERYRERRKRVLGLDGSHDGRVPEFMVNQESIAGNSTWPRVAAQVTIARPCG
jgi:hypothetical protein